MRPNINLGDEVKDRITGMTGIVMAITEWFNGCKRVIVQPQSLKDGTPVKEAAFDIEQLELIEANKVPPKPVERRTGGPMPTPSRCGNSDPEQSDIE